MPCKKQNKVKITVSSWGSACAGASPRSVIICSCMLMRAVLNLIDLSQAQRGPPRWDSIDVLDALLATINGHAVLYEGITACRCLPLSMASLRFAGRTARSPPAGPPPSMPLPLLPPPCAPPPKPPARAVAGKMGEAAATLAPAAAEWLHIVPLPQLSWAFFPAFRSN